ncbi:hypothetical protein Vafri_9207 [Volvox africanus]|uniref:RNA helicase n=1 Tax=Volvox africanus TaxID=51714 RepID=A0A8J4B3W6_9CHLO|nr:hypothetical protein Vafri_9207 [Volvox africanus]
MTKTSKRQQKNKQVQSLRSKAGGSSLGLANGLDLLSDELKQQYEESGIDPTQLIMAQTSKSTKAAKQGAPPQPPVERELSKSQLRKLKQVQLKKERRDKISQVLAQLHDHAASDATLSVLRPLHQRGHRETKKQRLRRELQLQRAGLAGEQLAEVLGDAPGGAGSELLRQRKVKDVDEMSGSDDDSGSEEGGEESEKEAEGKEGKVPSNVPASGAGWHASERRSGGGGNGSDDDEDGGMDGDGRPQNGQTAPAGGDSAAAARKAALQAARREAARIREKELGGVVPAVHDEQLRDPEVAASRRQAAAAAAEAAQFPHRVVHVTRPAAISEARMGLPIIGMEADIMEAVLAHDVVVLAGETGCGKTTQVPQFLLEAGYGCRDFPERAGTVGITQPRRVAAVSTAERVAEELDCGIGEMVGYQVRYDRAVGAATRLKFMTDGILLRELQMDFLLSGYSVIIVDEAHERALNTDLLLGMLSRVVPMRRRMWRERQEAVARGERPVGHPVYPLKLIIMSATLRTSDFTENKRLFATPPPVINVPARQYPVTVHFSRRTEMVDYVSTAFRKVTRIHAELPPGGILVFLTGQREVNQLCKKLKSHYSARRRRATAMAGSGAGAGGGRGVDTGGGDGDDEGNDDGEEAELAAAAPEQYGGGGDAAEVAGDFAERRRRGGEDQEMDDYEELNGDEDGDEDEEEVQVLGGDQFTPEEIAAAEQRFEEAYGKSLLPSGPGSGGGGDGSGGAMGPDQGGPAPVHVLPLYAMLPQAQQAKVFAPHPPGHRLIIVATNVAETSLTIPGIRYVVDAGRSKQKLLEEASSGQMAQYDVRWISKASASQRAGRAGRTCPGHAYRLYSSAHFNDTFPEHSPPEIVNTSLEGVVLVMKSMGVDKVHNFPFPTPPDAAALRAAHRCLEALCALTPESGRLTEIGRAMAAFPISPRHARMLLEVLKWHKSAGGGGGGSGGDAKYDTIGVLSVPEQVARRAGRALPYAVALAAAVSIESPFVHIDTVGVPESAADGGDAAAAADGDGEGGGGGGGDDTTGGKRRKEQTAHGGARRKRRGDGDGDGDGDGGDSDNPSQEEDESTEGDRQRGGVGPGPASVAAAAAREAARRRRQHAAAMQAQFRCGRSDALSALAALVAFESSGESEDFAAAHFLHSKNLREAADLHRQLLRVLAMQQVGAVAAAAAAGGALAEELAAAAKDLAASLALPGALPTTAAAAAGGAALVPERVALVLRRALAAGWADQVAKRARSSEYLAQLEESRRKRHAVRYQPACLSEGHVFLHPRSALHGDAPEFLVYMQLLRTEKRPYMAGLTAIEGDWLTECGTPLCMLSAAPLANPPPSYRGPPVDAVMAWREARYGIHDWALPPVAVPHPDVTERAAVFAAALLEGRVLPAVAELRPHLAASPAMLLRPELRGVARVGELVGALVRAKVDSRSSLAAAWRSSQPTLLQRELAAWLPRAQHVLLLRLWPQLVADATAAAAPLPQPAALQTASGKKEKRGGDGLRVVRQGGRSVK